MKVISASPAKATSTKKYTRADYRPPDFDIPNAEMKMEIHETTASIETRYQLSHNQGHGAWVLPLNVCSDQTKAGTPYCKIIDVYIDDRTVDWQSCLKGDVLELPITGERAEVKIKTEVDHANNESGAGLFGSDGVIVGFTEPIFFNRIVPYPTHRMEIRPRFAVEISTDPNQFPDAYSNGNLVWSKMADGRRVVRFEDEPKSSYLWSIAVGKFVPVEKDFRYGDGVPNPDRKFVFLMPKTKDVNPDRVTNSADALAQATNFIYDRYGQVLDYDNFRVALVDGVNIGACECRGLVIFNIKYCATQSGETGDRTGLFSLLAMVHEYAHNWAGNDAFVKLLDAPLKEVLASYLHQRIMERIVGPFLSRAHAVTEAMRDSFPVETTSDVLPILPDAYTEGTVFEDLYRVTGPYQKGPEVIRMVSELVGGDDVFDQRFANFLEAHHGKQFDLDSLFEGFVDGASSTEREAVLRLKEWITRPGISKVDVKTEVSDAGDSVTFTLNQTRPGHDQDGPLFVPFRFSVFDEGGTPLELGTHFDEGDDGADSDQTYRAANGHQFFIVDQAETTVTLNAKPGTDFRNANFSFNTRFSAPVMVSTDMSLDNDLACFKADPDGVAKWAIWKGLVNREILRIANDLQVGGGRQDPPEAFYKALGVVLEQDFTPDVFSRLLEFPTPYEILGQMDTPDVEAAITAHRHIMAKFAQHNGQALQALYDRFPPGETYTLDATGVGIRQTRARILELMAITQQEEAKKRAEQLLENGNGIADQCAALSCLVQVCLPDEASGILSKWETAHPRDDSLGSRLTRQEYYGMIGAIQAPETLAQLRRFHQEGILKPDSPNEIRSIFRGFGGNLPVFHQKNGSGYEFVANLVAEISNGNPELAGILLLEFDFIQRLDTDRIQKALAAIEAIEPKVRALGKTAEGVVTKIEGLKKAWNEKLGH